MDHAHTNPPAASLADIVASLQADTSLAPRRLGEMVSALQTTARLLGVPLSALPADPGALRLRFKSVSPAAGGFKQSRLNNIRSLVLAALKVAGVKVMAGRSPAPLDLAWHALRERLDIAHRRGLSRFMSFCSARGVAPSAVTEAIITAFADALERTSFARTPTALHRRTCLLWNSAAETLAGWPQLTVAVTLSDRRYAMDWDEFPHPFRVDGMAFLHHIGNQDVFAEDYAVSVRPSTVNMRRKQILQIATALVRSGVPASAITSLAVLVQVPHAKAALRYLLDRAGKPSTSLHQQALLIKTIARFWVKLPDLRDGIPDPRQDIKELGELCRRLAVKQGGMTTKNRERLRQFDNPNNIYALLNLPHRVFGELKGRDTGTRQEALRAMMAMAVECLLRAPVRANNLVDLRFDQHLLRVSAGSRRTTHIVIAADETKNKAPYEVELSRDTADLLAIYQARYQPRVSKAGSPWVFPNESGDRRSNVPFCQSLCAFILRETGIKMTVHLFRHLAVKLHLDHSPEDIETARLILGHKSSSTTLRFYAEMKNAAAFRRYDALVTSLRAGAPPTGRRSQPAKPQGGPL